MFEMFPDSQECTQYMEEKDGEWDWVYFISIVICVSHSVNSKMYEEYCKWLAHTKSMENQKWNVNNLHNTT